MSSDDERKRLQDIIDNIDRIGGHLADYDFDRFVGDKKTVDAVERCLQRITEAAIKIGATRMAVLIPELPMARVRGLGNALRHDYDLISLRVIWDMNFAELPSLREACVAALR